MAKDLNANGAKAEFVQLDVANRDQCIAAADAVASKHGSLDILVNNAGIGHVGTILNTESEDLVRLFAVNVRGMFDFTKAFIVPMIERRNGVIINIASIGGIIAIRERRAYCTTKLAVVGLTKSLALDHAKEYRQSRVRTNTGALGR